MYTYCKDRKARHYTSLSLLTSICKPLCILFPISDHEARANYPCIRHNAALVILPNSNAGVYTGVIALFSHGIECMFLRL